MRKNAVSNRTEYGKLFVLVFKIFVFLGITGNVRGVSLDKGSTFCTIIFLSQRQLSLGTYFSSENFEKYALRTQVDRHELLYQGPC